MKYYVIIRNRANITIDYLNSVISKPGKLPNWAWAYGPFQTFEEAVITYQSVLNHVDDDDYGIFAIYNKNWYRYNSLSKTMKKL